MFYGRKKEIQQLQSFVEDSQARVACVYGRQGIGKTSLLKHFLQDKKHIYFTAYATTGSHQTALFAEVLGKKASTLPPISEVENRLRAVLDEVTSQVVQETILVIDHYPHFAKADVTFDKILFEYFTTTWKDIPLKLILCGDSYLQMQKIVLESKALWKKEINLVMEVKGLGFYETKEFFSDDVSKENVALFYGMTGGIPYHLQHVGTDVATSVMNIFLKEEASLLPETTMSLELRELSYYNHILLTLADGHNRVNKISECVNKPKDVVVPYMSTLMSIGIVTKENPVTEKTNRKKTRYSIISPFDLFWYKFVAPHMDLYYEKQWDNLLQEHITPALDSFMSSVFISMCREYLEQLNAQEKLPFHIQEIGNWWQNDDDKQISEGFDLVALGETQEQEAMIFARCYYMDQPVGISALKDLIDMTKQVKGKKNVFYLVFSKSGFHENTTTVAATIKNIILVSLDDIFHMTSVDK